MDLVKHYNDLYNISIHEIKKDNYITDPLIDDVTDQRLGITLIIRPSKKVKNNIQKFLDVLKQVDPSQYYYPNSDMHITVMSIISCYNGFALDKISIPDYVDLIKKSLQNIKPFQIHFKGITASTSSNMVQGFPENASLNTLRDNLRQNFKNSNLEQSLDKRYAIQTAHSTIVRFKHELKQKNDFLRTLEDFKDYDFGSFEVNEVLLVFNDWYLRKERTKILEFFSIP